MIRIYLIFLMISDITVLLIYFYDFYSAISINSSGGSRVHLKQVLLRF